MVTQLVTYWTISLFLKLVCSKPIAIDLSKQIELKNPELKQQIDLIGKLEDDKVTIFFMIEKSEETIFEFSQKSVSII